MAALRARKHREDKPFALMVARRREAARRLVTLDPVQEALLSSTVAGRSCSRRAGPTPPVAAAVAPRAPELGVMLPYTPLHHLLLADFAVRDAAAAALVMTSGNVSDEPIAFRDDDALERLAPIADLFLLHDREIETRTDDSVIADGALGGRTPAAAAAPLARATCPARCAAGPGAPAAAGLRRRAEEHLLPGQGRPGLGRPPHRRPRALRDAARPSATGIAHFERLFAVAPELVAHDLHPDYLSTAYALERDGRASCVAVQHHHAHLAACLAEHGLDGPGRGRDLRRHRLRADGTVWGGELLVGGPGRVRARRLAVAGADARRRGRDPPALADGLRLAGRGARRAAAGAAPACRTGRVPALGGDEPDRRQRRRSRR